jgi:hypothetical protein
MNFYEFANANPGLVFLMTIVIGVVIVKIVETIVGRNCQCDEDE